MEMKELPGYWQEQLVGKVKEIREKQEELRGHGGHFIFFTDGHVQSNAMYSPKIIDVLRGETGIDMIVFGGDIIQTHKSEEEALGLMDKWLDATDGLNAVYIHGNHDSNPYGTGQISDETYYAHMSRHTERLSGDPHKMYFTMDREKERLRYVFMDTRDGKYTFMDEAQLAWVKEQCLSAPAGWGVVVIPHMCVEVKGLNGCGKQIVAAIDSVYDDMKASLVGVIGGHSHIDSLIMSEKGYPVISTTCDAGSYEASTYDVNYPVRTFGTTAEQAFDVYHIDLEKRVLSTTRIGIGADRVFHF